MTRQWDTIAPAMGDLWWRNIWDCTWLLPEGWRPWEAKWWGPVEYVGPIRYERIQTEWCHDEAMVFADLV